jgi:TonB-dependent receptor
MASFATPTALASSNRDLATWLRGGASVIALCALATAAPAFAQTKPQTNASGVENSAGEVQNNAEADAPETRVADATEVAQDDTGESDTIVVTGLRQSLANSQNIKRNADTVVDAITAEDIGALPDRSVTEALQRVPGVAINRFAGSNDPDHFSVEGSGVVIRGLNFVRSEFNGRDTFSANAGRQLGFSDVPAELLGSVEVYKNVTAEMIEGGLAGTVNLNTRLPFDKRGFHFGFSAEANYSDFIKKLTPTASILVSNTWETGIGTIGLLGSFAYSQVKSRADGMQVTNIQTRDDAIVTQAFSTNQIVRNRLPGGDVLYAPLGATYRTQLFDRERAGYAAAAQWESTNREMLLTAQFLRSDARQSWGERTFEAGGDLSEYNTFPVGCGRTPGTQAGGTTTRAGCTPGNFTDYEYDEDGVFERGFITFPGNGWRSSDSGSATARIPTGGSQYNNSRREVLQDTMTADYGLNFKWNPNDRWSVNLDGQFVDATTENLDFTATGSIFADSELDLTGDVPQAVIHKPQIIRADWAAPNTRLEGQTDEQYFGDKMNYFWRSAMDHIEDSEGQEWAFKADVAYNFEDDIPGLRRIKFGARYSDRDQTVRSTTYNWGVLSEVWAGNAGAVHLDEAPLLPLEQHEFTNFFRGQATPPPSSWFYGVDLIKAYEHASSQFMDVNRQWNLDRGNTTPATGGGSGWVPLALRPGVIAGTPFLPAEIQTVSEATKAGYVMLSFGSDEPVFGNVRIDGNIGVRYVHTDARSLGSMSFPQVTAIGGGQPYSLPDGPDANTDGDGICDPKSPPAGTPPGTPPPELPAVCDLGPAGYAQAQQFSNGANFPSNAVNKFGHWLPSLNIKIGIGRDVIVRLAASKVLSRPDIAYTRNFLAIGTDTSSGFRFQATSGNPYLLPVTAKTFDAGIEWYFASVGSLTFNAFYKDINGFFYNGVTTIDVTNNGVTFPVDIRGPANFPENGKVKGFELAYQHAFTFLPGLLSGLGVNANYTHVKSKGVPNALIATPNAPPTGEGNLPLEQLSKHNANITLFYEKGDLSLRGSYSWRSKFLLTARDVIFPYFPIYNDATGQLDASLFYSVTPQIKVGIQGVNLLNEVTKTIQVFTPTGMEGPRSYFMNDRRITFAVRGNF